jgi:hypothetical protein
MNLSHEFFTPQKFSKADLELYKQSAKRNLEIAHRSVDSEVVFHFGFMSLIKIGIYCLAKAGHRVKSQPGHHRKIIEYLSEVLESKDVLMIGDRMRKNRNLDFYGPNTVSSMTKAKEYLKFVDQIFEKI